MPTTLITGSAHRIGAAIAAQLHQNGHNIMLHYGQSEVAAMQLCTQFNEARSDSAATIRYDLTQLDGLAAIVE